MNPNYHMAKQIAKRVASSELLPLMDPLFNLREACKQMCLLEDHLVQPQKRCMDCITKHFLTLEGLFEEAATLDTARKWPHLIDGQAQSVRGLFSLVLGTELADAQCLEAAQGLRFMRKAIMPDARRIKLAFHCPHR